MTTTRRILGIAAGFVATVAAALILSRLAREIWPTGWSRTFADPTWGVWALLMAVGHLCAGFAGGYVTGRASATRAKADIIILMTLLLLFSGIQILGDWGHNFLFGWHLSLTFAAMAGAYVGWRTGVNRYPDRDPQLQTGV